MKERQRAILMMAACSVMWSIAGIFIKSIPWNPLVIAGSRSVIAALVILVYMRAKRMPIAVNRSSLTSGAALAATMLCFVAANKLTTAANAIVLQFTAPVFIILFSMIFLHQKFRRQDYLVVVLVILGVSCCFLGQLGGGSLLGNVIAVISGVFFAAMFLASGNAVDESSRMSGLLLGQLLTGAVGLVAIPFTAVEVRPSILISVLILGVVQLGIPYVLFGLASGKCPPLVLCLTSAVEPLLNPMWVFLFDGESPGLLALIGGVIVIGSITISNLYDARSAALPAAEATDTREPSEHS